MQETRWNWIYGIFVWCVILAAGTGPVHAGNGNRAGTSAAPELLIPVGARGTGMGGATIADAVGTEALFWNPAGVAFAEGTELSFSYLDYIADIQYSSFNATMSLGDVGTIGFATRVLNIGDIIVTTVDAPNGTGEILSPTFVNIGLTYSRRVTDRVAFGTTINFIHEAVDRETAQGVAFDFGFQYATGVKGLRLGVVVKHLGPDMRFDGADLEESVPIPDEDPIAADQRLRLTLASFELPTYVQFGTSYAMPLSMSHAVTLTTAYRNNSFTDDDVAGGIEYGYRSLFFLRGGYVSSAQEDFLFGATFGFGLQFQYNQSAIRFDYSNAESEFFDNNQWFSLAVGF